MWYRYISNSHIAITFVISLGVQLSFQCNNRNSFLYVSNAVAGLISTMHRHFWLFNNIKESLSERILFDAAC